MVYDGFISYSHAADGKLAPSLQRALQRLAKKWNTRRALRIFRDETGLSTNPQLWSGIESALDESSWFVLLASPAAASSEWVNKEIEHWLATKSVDRVLPVLTDGTWEWDVASGDFTAESSAVPQALRGALRDEPRHLDLRWARDETDLDLRNSRFRGAVADLAAPMHGVAKDELEGEDIRQHRRARRLARAAVSVVVLLLVMSIVFGVFAVNQRDQANGQRSRAEKNANESLTRGLAIQSGSLLRTNHIDEALIVAAQAELTAARTGGSGTAAQLAKTALLRTITAYPGLAGFFNHQPGTVQAMAYSPDGSKFVSKTETGDVRAWDALTRRELPVPSWKLEDPGAQADVAVNDHGALAVPSGNSVVLWDLAKNRPLGWQPPDGQPVSEPGPFAFKYVALSDSGLLAVAYGVTQTLPDDATHTTLDVWDITHRRRVGARLTFRGAPHGVDFSRDGAHIAVTLSPSTTRLAVQLVDAATVTTGPLLDAHHGSFFQALLPFQSAAVFSPDDTRVSSVASRGSQVSAFGLAVSTESAVATFDTHTGARIASPAVAVGQEVLGIAPDLHEIAVQTGTGVLGTSVAVIDSRTDAQLAQVPIPGLKLAAPVAFDPTRPIVVAQSGPGSLTVTNWTQVGAVHFARTALRTPAAAPVGLAPHGVAVGLAEALRDLGLSTRCFAPLLSSCNYHTDQPQGLLLGSVYRASDPRRPWTATTSAAGDVAILAGNEIAIWNPVRRRIERRLTGVPSKCGDFGTYDLAFVGTAHNGRVVLGCPPLLLAWDLHSSRSTSAWRHAWSGTELNAPTPVLISNDDSTVAVTDQNGARFLDAHTGHERARGPLVIPTTDSQTGGAFSPDGHTYAQLQWSGTLTLIDPATGKVRRVLTSSTGNVGDLGVICPGCGPTSGNPPAIAFSPDAGLVVVWHDTIGMEIWDARTGESLAILGGRTLEPAGSLTALDGTGTLDAIFRHRLVVTFGSSTTLQTSDVHDLVRVVDGAPTSDYASQLRTITWSMRPADWILAACDIARRDLTDTEWKALVSSTAPYQQTCTPVLARAAPHR